MRGGLTTLAAQEAEMGQPLGLSQSIINCPFHGHFIQPSCQLVLASLAGSSSWIGSTALIRYMTTALHSQAYTLLMTLPWRSRYCLPGDRPRRPSAVEATG